MVDKSTLINNTNRRIARGFRGEGFAIDMAKIHAIQILFSASHKQIYRFALVCKMIP